MHKSTPKNWINILAPHGFHCNRNHTNHTALPTCPLLLLLFWSALSCSKTSFPLKFPLLFYNSPFGFKWHSRWCCLKIIANKVSPNRSRLWQAHCWLLVGRSIGGGSNRHQSQQPSATGLAASQPLWAACAAHKANGNNNFVLVVIFFTFAPK